MKGELIKQNKELTEFKESNIFILKCGYVEIELNLEEYIFVDELVKKISSGEISSNSIYRCKRTGESLNLANFQYIIRKKNPKIKVFGEDLKL